MTYGGMRENGVGWNLVLFASLPERLEVLLLLTGGTSFWIDYWEDFKEILGDIQDLFRLIFKRRENIPAINKKDKLSTALTDGIQMTVCITNATNILTVCYCYIFRSSEGNQHFLTFSLINDGW